MSKPTEDPAGLKRVIDQAARELADEARRAMTMHPESEELVAYQEGRLAEGDAVRVRRHLVACSECAQLLSELGVFDLPEDSALRPSPAETATEWERFQQRLGEVEQEASVAASPGRLWTPIRMLLAASIVLAVTGLAFWAGGMVQRSWSLGGREIATHPYLLDLTPEGEGRRRDAATTPEIEAPAGTDLLVLRLNLGDQTPYPLFRVDILDASGITIQSQANLQRQPTGDFLVLVERASLPPGRYEVRLVAADDNEDQVLATYSFQILYTE
jgi:hypothetical protein